MLACNMTKFFDKRAFITIMLSFAVQSGVYFTEVGDNIGRERGVLYLSMDKRRSWIPVKEFVNVRHHDSSYTKVTIFVTLYFLFQPNWGDYSEEKSNFFQQQLSLYASLCYVRLKRDSACQKSAVSEPPFPSFRTETST